MRYVDLTLVTILSTITAACGSKLPEPETPGAQVYVRYCSAKGCHDPIPPKQAGPGYWDAKISAMLGVIRESSRPMPSPEEVEQIRAYLHKHAMHFEG